MLNHIFSVIRQGKEALVDLCLDIQVWAQANYLSTLFSMTMIGLWSYLRDPLAAFGSMSNGPCLLLLLLLLLPCTFAAGIKSLTTTITATITSSYFYYPSHLLQA